MNYSKNEVNLLQKISSGLLDGIVGSVLETGKSTTWMEIKNGKATQYKKSASKKFFNNEENKKIPGKLRVLKEWKTADELLEFLGRFGFGINDSEVQEYYKEQRK